MSQRGRTPVYIMAVPFIMERVKNAKRLADETGGTVVFDQTRNIMDTYVLVMEAAGEGPCIVLQDDVYLHPEWRERVEGEIDKHPDSIIQFFSLKKRDATLPPRWEPGKKYFWNQCYYLPKGYPPLLAEAAREWQRKYPRHTGDDTCMAAWLDERGEDYWHYAPSLVQHMPWTSSVYTPRSPLRQSPSFEEEQ